MKIHFDGRGGVWAFAYDSLVCRGTLLDAGLVLGLDRSGPFCANGLTLEDQLARLKVCHGARGANLDYLLETAQQLTALGIVDRGIDALIACLG